MLRVSPMITKELKAQSEYHIVNSDFWIQIAVLILHESATTFALDTDEAAMNGLADRSQKMTRPRLPTAFMIP